MKGEAKQRGKGLLRTQSFFNQFKLVDQARRVCGCVCVCVQAVRAR